MKILSAEQIRQLDASTIAEQQISGADLMERAAKVFSNWFHQHFSFFNSIHIYCGTGNNGGDGLCIARHLILNGKQVAIFILGDINNASADFNLNYNRLLGLAPELILIVKGNNDLPLEEPQCIIDCIFGTGLNRAPEDIYAATIEHINNSIAFTFSIDIPSGLYCDIPTNHICVEADITLTFELPKLCFFFPENAQYTGEWIIKNIGLSNSIIATTQSNYTFLTEDIISDIIQPRSTFSHKGSYGHALIIAGKPGMTGAAELCGLASLTAGAGLVTSSQLTADSAHPEIMHINADEIPSQLKENKYNSIGIGPGLGNDENTFELLKSILPIINFPVVLDADALNCIAEHQEILNLISQNSILTPHPKEFERLFGKDENWDGLIENLLTQSKKYNCIIIYKRAFTIIANPEGEIYFNSTGNAGMATAGSGDVLTGIITALLAQGYNSMHAAMLGVFIHGLAGDIALSENDGQNLIAGDIISHIQLAFSTFN